MQKCSPCLAGVGAWHWRAVGLVLWLGSEGNLGKAQCRKRAERCLHEAPGSRSPQGQLGEVEYCCDAVGHLRQAQHWGSPAGHFESALSWGCSQHDGCSHDALCWECSQLKPSTMVNQAHQQMGSAVLLVWPWYQRGSAVELPHRQSRRNFYVDLGQ